MKAILRICNGWDREVDVEGGHTVLFRLESGEGGSERYREAAFTFSHEENDIPIFVLYACYPIGERDGA